MIGKVAIAAFVAVLCQAVELQSFPALSHPTGVKPKFSPSSANRDNGLGDWVSKKAEKASKTEDFGEKVSKRAKK